MTYLNRIITNKFVRSALSLCIGYGLWSSIAHVIPVSQSYTIPVYFYRIPNDISIQAPEHISVRLQAPRRILHNHTHGLAAYIDATLLSEGKQPLTIEHKELFLPEAVKLVNYNFTHITVTKKISL